MLLIDSLEHDDFFSLWIGGEEVFFQLIGIVFYHGISGFEDELGRAIVLLEIDDLCVGVVFLK
jgi:hypothetical protein